MKCKVKFLAGFGIISVLLMVVSVWYSITYNESRWIEPMELSTYQFRIKDLPILGSLGILIIFILFAFIQLGKTIIQNKQETKRTRKLNPNLGYFGFLGFLGLSGIPTYQSDQIILPFCFFLFFGFFGFFYEGKMSNTLMDERYKENEQKAELAALKIGFMIIAVLLLLLSQGSFWGNMEYTMIIMIIALSLDLALVLFLSKYLLYRYDHNEEFDDSEE